MAPPKDIARSYPKRGLTADVGFRSEPKFCGDGAATFPTLSDYAQTAASADLALGETYTLCAWVRHVKPAGANHAVNIGVSGTIKVSISFFGGVSNPEVYVYNGVNNMNTTGVFNSAAHTWYHIAVVVKPGAGNTQILINGIDRTASHSYTFPLSGSPVVHIGGDYSASNGNWQGDLANVALFTSSLTEDQVRQAMRASDYASHAAIATLEAFYPLSENFNDSTGNHNATASGSPEFRPNRPQLPRGLDLTRGAAQARVYTGRAIDLDGSADYLETTLDSALGSTFTITAWIYKDNVSSNRFVALAGNGGTGAGSAASIYVNADKLGGWDGATNLNTTLSLSANRWYHVALVANGTTTLTYYLDGQSDTVTSAGAPNPNSSRFLVGAYSPSYFFHDGKISGMKVFNQALTADQIKELYHHPEQVLPTGVSASNLIHRWALSDYNDATAGGMGGRYFQDSAGDNALEDKGSCSMAFAQPVPCPQLGLQQSATRLLFPGGTTTHNAVATTTALGTNASVSCWLQCNNISPVGLVWSVGLSGTNHWYIYIQSGNIIIGPGNITIGTVTEGAWTHLVVTTDSGSPPYKAYVNGTEVSLTGTDTARSLTSGSFEIGNQDVASSPFVFNGILNDVACWNTELSLSDAQSLYNSGVMGMDVSTVQSSNLKGWWKCDDLTTFKDYSGNGANATVTNTFVAASFPENASGSTIVGDFSLKRKGVSVLNPTATPAAGSTPRALIANDGSLSPDPSKGGYSFSAFVRFEQASGANPWFPMIFGATNYLNVSQRFILNFGNLSVAAAPPGLSITDGSAQRDYDWPAPVPNPEEWHQLAFTIDFTTSPNTTFKLYLDGALVSTQATNVHSAFDPGDIIVGSYTSGNGNFPGAIACFKMYQAKLSDNEIEQIYRSDLRLIKGLNNE